MREFTLDEAGGAEREEKIRGSVRLWVKDVRAPDERGLDALTESGGRHWQ